MKTREVFEIVSKEEGIKLVNEKKSDKDIYEYLVTKGLTDSYEEYISESQIIAKEKFSKMEKQDILKELEGVELSDDQLEQIAGGDKDDEDIEDNFGKVTGSDVGDQALLGTLGSIAIISAGASAFLF